MRLNTNLLCVLGALIAPGMLLAQAVKITPVGARTGDFCAPDRALILEDPTGVRILYDPATTVAGGSDMRLGRIDAILVSHAHGDHLGNAKLNQDPDSPAARCDSATTLPSTNSNAAEIAAAKNSAVIVSGDLAPFLNAKIQAVLGVTVPGCAATGPANTTVVPLTQPCTGNLGYGAKRTLMFAGAQSGVQVALVSALHGNGLPSTLLADPLKSEMTANGLTFAPGGASGYVVTFTNGLRVYLSGDTGLLSDMQAIVRDYYKANLVVLNVGDIFTIGPEEGAFAIDTLIRPAAVIPSHVNEVATTNGQVNPGTKTARFIDLVKTAPVYPPLSGVTMQFDGNGRCVSGCPVGRQAHESH